MVLGGVHYFYKGNRGPILCFPQWNRDFLMNWWSYG
jgi:hypothetical protein